MDGTNELLTAERVLELGIVAPNNKDAVRPTTIDATIGKIVTKKGEIKEETANIPPRGIAWVMSEERFKLPNNVTGISTLRTTWTRRGILTLTVGIVDPGYDGFLGTAIINFSKNDFALTKGDTFFRTAFFQHAETSGISRHENEKDYTKGVIQDSAAFSNSFLTIDSLAGELAPKLFGLPRIGLAIAIVAIVLTLFSLVVPPALGLWHEVTVKNTKIELLQSDVQSLEAEISSLKTTIARAEQRMYDQRLVPVVEPEELSDESTPPN